MGHDVLGIISPRDSFHSRSKELCGQRIIVKEIKVWDDLWCHGDVAFPDLPDQRDLHFFEFRPRRVK